MPATSKSMQRTMGWALACQRGDTTNCPPNIQKLAKTLSPQQLHDFAATKHHGLPERRKKKKKKVQESLLTFQQFLVQESLTSVVTNSEIAQQLWNELTITNQKYFNQLHHELLANQEAMDDGERLDYYDNFLYRLYVTDSGWYYTAAQIGQYQRSHQLTCVEINQPDETGQGIWDYLGEIITAFLTTENLL